jgi:hypothetical protein
MQKEICLKFSQLQDLILNPQHPLQLQQSLPHIMQPNPRPNSPSPTISNISATANLCLAFSQTQDLILQSPTSVKLEFLPQNNHPLPSSALLLTFPIPFFSFSLSLSLFHFFFFWILSSNALL